jgi:hypothetical protein
MEIQEIRNGMRDWLGDPPREILDSKTADFHIFNALDFYAGMLANAGKLTVRYKEIIQTNTKETSLQTDRASLALDQPNLVRRRISAPANDRDIFQTINIEENMDALTSSENNGIYSCLFYSRKPAKMILSWYPGETLEYFEIYATKMLFDGLGHSTEINDIPELFHYLIMARAAFTGLSEFMKPPFYKEWQMFVQSVTPRLQMTIAEREILWRNFLASPLDQKRRHTVQPYSPLRDRFYQGGFEDY